MLTGSTSVEFAENSNTTVGTYTATDPERSLPPGTCRGVDEDDFVITDGVLTFKSLPDREGATDANTDSVYHVTVEASDGNNTARLPVTITVTNVNEKPVFVEGSATRSVVENTLAGVNVGDPIKATDPEGDALTYTLIGSVATAFEIDSSRQLKTKILIDREAATSYFGQVHLHDRKDADGNLDTTTDHTISVDVTVEDINEPPVVTGTTTTEYAENDIRSVETYTATDPENDDITWLLSGADEDDFEITNGDLEFHTPPNYEVKRLYFATVHASDGHSTTTHPVRIDITDVNEDPVFPDTEDGQRSVDENTVAGQNIGSPVSATDPDRVDTLTYILDSTGTEFFDIDESTGQLKTKAELDTEARDTYSFSVDVHDGKDADGNPATTSDAFEYVTITVENVNEAPVVSGTTSTEFAENSALTVAVYDARDPEGETVDWDLSGADEDDFEITSGALSFLKSPDYEAKSQYSVTVETSDGVLTSSLVVTVTITNEDEPGTVELSSQQPQVGTPLTATLKDPDGSASDVSWTWESSANGSSNWTTVSTTTAGNSTSNSYTPVTGDRTNYLRVTASYTDREGSGKIAQVEATQTVRPAPPVNHPPQFASNTASRSVPENSQAGTLIGDPVMATDQNQDDTLTYSLEGIDAASFGINSSSGQLEAKLPLDKETKSTYTVVVVVSDPSNVEVRITVTITVTNVDEAPELTGRTAVEHVETANGPVATYTAKDPEEGAITWDLSGDDEEDFTIAGGNLNFASTPDLENPADADQNNVYRVTVEASDGTSTSTLVVTVIVIGANEPATFPGTTTSREVTENTLPGQNVGGPIRASDPENDELTYTLSGPDRQHFDIATSTGQILTKGDLNYESSRKSYSVTVSVTDGKDADGNSDPGTDASIQVTINVIDENEAPVLTGATSTEAMENATDTVAIYTATDPEGKDIQWTVLGTDAADFSITDNDGVLRIDNAPDYETKNLLPHNGAGLRRRQHRKIGRDGRSHRPRRRRHCRTLV